MTDTAGIGPTEGGRSEAWRAWRRLLANPFGLISVIGLGILVLAAIEKVNSDLGTTTALITHNRAIADMADRVIELADGRIADVRENSERRHVAELEW